MMKQEANAMRATTSITFILFFLTTLFYGLTSASLKAEVKIEMAFDQVVIQPGDLTVLNARMTSQEYATFAISITKDEHLRLVASELGVVELVEGGYRQQHRWIMQGIFSGQVAWEDVVAEVVFSDRQQQVKLPLLSLEIKPYESLDLSDEAEPLRVEKSAVKRMSALLLTVVIILGGVLVLVFLKRKRGP